MTERALVCRSYNFQILPWQLDDLDVYEVRAPLRLVFVHDAFLKKGRDLKAMTQDELDTVGRLLRLKDLLAEEARHGGDEHPS